MTQNYDDKTFIVDLQEEINDALGPIRSLISIAHDLGEDMYDFHEMMEIVLEKVEGNIIKIFELVENNLGTITLQGVKCGEFLEFKGKRYGSCSSPELFKAFLMPAEKAESPKEIAV